MKMIEFTAEFDAAFHCLAKRNEILKQIRKGQFGECRSLLSMWFEDKDMHVPKLYNMLETLESQWPHIPEI